MKSKNLLVLSLLFILIPFLYSCNESTMEENLLGRWRVSKTEFTKGENSSDEIGNLLMEEMLSTVYEFMEDEKFKIQSMRIHIPLEGTWRLNEGKNELYYEYETNGLSYKSTYQIEMSDENTFIISQDLGDGFGQFKATLTRMP